MNFKNISAWSIRNPIPPLVMFFGLTVAGIVGMPLGLVLLAVADEPSLQGWIAASMLVMVVLVATGVRIGVRGLPVGVDGRDHRHSRA